MKFLLWFGFFVAITISITGRPHENEYPIRTGDPRFYAYHTARLASGEASEISESANALMYARTSRGVRELITALKGDLRLLNSDVNRPVVKFYVAKALGKTNTDLAVKPLLDEWNLTSSKIQTYDSSKKRTLKDGYADSQSVSSPFFFEKDDMPITLAGGEMLRSLGSLPLSNESEEALKQALAHPNFYVRGSAADGMKFSDNKKFLGSLNDALGKEKDDFAKLSILCAIVILNQDLDSKSFWEVTGFLKNDNPFIRIKTSETLGILKFRISEEALTNAILVENDERVLAQLKRDLKLVKSVD